ncbi:hypothetical protein ES703_100944 [subsurface metagenome]
MGHYASRSRLCELVLDDEYWGVYVLMEKIKRDKNRVDIATLTPDETTGDDLTGGYIIKIDKWDGEQLGGWESAIRPYPGAEQSIYYQFHYPKPNDIVWQQMDYIQDYIATFESLMSRSDYNDPVKGYPSIIDVDSFIDYFIANEIAKNVDAYRLSAFMYKDRDSNGGQLTIGPVWDFNLCYGNADYYDGATTDVWELAYLTENPEFLQDDWFQVPFWWRKLFDDPAFMVIVADRWQELGDDVFYIPTILATIDSLVTLLDEAQVRNFEKWPVLDEYVWPNAYIGGTYEAEIDTLKNWIAARIDWMEDQLLGTTSHSTPDHYRLLQNYPNPFNRATTLRFELPHTTSVRLTIYDLQGREIIRLVDGKIPAGMQKFIWHGYNATGRELPSGLYIARIVTPEYSESIKMLLLK